MREFEPFEAIWEQDAKWLSGRELLQRAVDDLKGKGLIAKQDSKDPSAISVEFPFHHTETPYGRVITLDLQIPQELSPILEERLRLILNSGEVI